MNILSMPIIGLDMDGVLLPTYEELVRLSDMHFGTNFGSWQNENWPDPSLPELWHGSSEEISHKDDVFIRSSSGIFAADPIDDVVAVCEKLSLNCKLLVITAGQPWQCSLKLDWLRRHFPFIPSENVTFTDPEVGRHPNKSDACRDLGVDIYVEDRYDFARSIVGTSSRTNVLLIERYAWSHGEPHPRIHTVRNWQEAGQLLVDVTS